jgi:hypothetical protein
MEIPEKWRGGLLIERFEICRETRANGGVVAKVRIWLVRALGDRSALVLNIHDASDIRLGDPARPVFLAICDRRADQLEALNYLVCDVEQDAPFRMYCESVALAEETR